MYNFGVAAGMAAKASADRDPIPFKIGDAVEVHSSDYYGPGVVVGFDENMFGIPLIDVQCGNSVLGFYKYEVVAAKPPA